MGFFSVKKKEKVELQSSFSGHYLMMLYICTKFWENISKDFKVFEQAQFPN